MPENAQVVITPATLPEGSCFATEQERLNAFTEHMTGVLPGNYSTVNVGPDAPTADDRGKPWVRTNPDGSPDGTYYYFDGSWKRRHPTSPGMIMFYLGAIGDVDALDGGAAGTVTTMSGPFWEVVTALAAKFPVGVGTTAGGTVIAVNGTGGEDKHVLTEAELPEHKHQMFRAGEENTSRDLNTTQSVFERGVFSTRPSYNLTRTEDGNTNQPTVGPTSLVGSGTAHNNLPPYVGGYWVKRTARIYFSIA